MRLLFYLDKITHIFNRLNWKNFTIFSKIFKI